MQNRSIRASLLSFYLPHIHVSNHKRNLRMCLLLFWLNWTIKRNTMQVKWKWSNSINSRSPECKSTVLFHLYLLIYVLTIIATKVSRTCTQTHTQNHTMTTTTTTTTSKRIMIVMSFSPEINRTIYIVCRLFESFIWFEEHTSARVGCLT